MTVINECGMSEISIMNWSLVWVGRTTDGYIQLYLNWVPMSPIYLWVPMSPYQLIMFCSGTVPGGTRT
jgi:hypothetical protein